MPHVRVVVLNRRHLEYFNQQNNLKVCDVLELDYSVRKQIGDENSDAMPWKEKNWIYATMPIGNPYVEQAEQYFIANEIKVARNSKSFSLHTIALTREAKLWKDTRSRP